MSLRSKIHRITCEPTNQHVVVSKDGHVLAESDRPVLVHESGLPVRYYIPRTDVRMELFEPTTHRSTCPWKGQASYWSATVGETVLDNVAWSYEDPIPDVEMIRGMLAFYSDRVAVEGEDPDP